MGGFRGAGSLKTAGTDRNAEQSAPLTLTGRLQKSLLFSLGGRAFLATVALLAFAAIVAPATVAPSALLSLLPFVAFLAVAAIGQHLVIQQRGLDISVAAIMCLAAVIVTKLPASDASPGQVFLYAVVALLMGLAAGAVNGILVTVFKVPALVTTIGVNAVLLAVTLLVSNAIPSQATPEFSKFTISLTLGVPNTIWIALVVAAIAYFVIERTTIGRRFVATSVSPAAAHAAGIPVERYQIATYMAAGLCYAIAGVMLAGFLSVPSIYSGVPYILSSVAAVVVGGNSVAGGARGSIIATVIGAIFLTFLGQLVLSAGLERSMQDVVEALIVLGGVGFTMLLARRGGKATLAAGTAPADGAALAQESGAALQLTGIYKSFGPVEALKGASFTAYPGEIHAIVGENGAGKSTLINVAAGVLGADRGSIVVKGEAGKPGPAARRAQGISVAYQHPALANDLSVLENFQLANPATTETEARSIIASVATPQLRMDIRQRIEGLSLAQRHVVEIARALCTNPAVLILDEPTEPFQHDDIRQLFALIKALRDKGVAIVYVSHRLHEIDELADRISVMRDGEIVASRPAAEFSAEEIIKLIAGRPLGQIFPPKSSCVQETRIAAENFSGFGFSNVSFAARAGEIIGLAGVEGEGQREFLRALAGVDRNTGGRVLVDGNPVAVDGPAALRRAGVGFVSDDRHAEGLFLNLSVRENIGIGILDEVSRAGVIDRAAEEKAARNASADFRVKTPSVEALVSNLSGGNQQKVLLGREVSGQPKVLLIDEPTKGVDIGARSEIYQRLRQLADDGVAVVLAASDGVELEGLCDRVYIFARGSIVKELQGPEISDAAITEANLTATASRAASSSSSSAVAGWRGFLASDHFPALILIALSAIVLFGTHALNEFFLSGFNIKQMLGLLAILCFIALGQYLVIMVGGIDLSLGPLAGFVVVLASFLLPKGASAIAIVGGAFLLLAICVAYGYLQGLLITRWKLPAVVVTLATFIGLQGLSLALRPRPKGIISNSLQHFFSSSLIFIPVGIILAILAFAVMEWLLYRHDAGRKLRAVGSNPLASHRLGVDGGRITRIAFALAALFTGIAGLMLAGQVGIGSGTTGVDYSLMSITAVVLGGVAVSGGRGSALAVLFGAVLMQSITSASSFLNSDASYQFLAGGLTTLIAACIFGWLRQSRSAHRFAH